MEAETQHKRNKLYNRLDSAIFAAEQAAREISRMEALPQIERDTAGKIGQELNGYNGKVALFRRAQHLSIK